MTDIGKMHECIALAHLAHGFIQLTIRLTSY